MPKILPLSVSPPRFELHAQAGQTVRAVAELSNASGLATQLNFATAEWELTPDGGVTLSEALKPALPSLGCHRAKAGDLAGEGTAAIQVRS